MFNLKDRINRFDRLMAAITFAEAGERETALEEMGKKPKKEKQKRIGSRIKRRENRRPDMRM